MFARQFLGLPRHSRPNSAASHRHEDDTSPSPSADAITGTAVAAAAAAAARVTPSFLAVTKHQADTISLGSSTFVMPEVDTREERLNNPKFQARFQENPPPDKEQLNRAWKLLEGYSKIPEDQVEPHIKAVRDKAWFIFPYGCIGRWRFLDLYLPDTAEYAGILERVKAGETFLDCGCCFGQALRQLAFDGAPAENLWGCDLRQDFIDLGYDLFRDRGSFGAHFAAGDMLNPDDAALRALDGRVNIVHAASFFHLFGWEDQVDLGVRLARFFKPGARAPTVVGRQIGCRDPLDPEVHAQRGLGRYHHDPASLQRLWDEIGAKTGTRWKVEMAVLEDSPVPDDREGGARRVVLRYVVMRVDPGLLGRVMERLRA